MFPYMKSVKLTGTIKMIYLNQQITRTYFFVRSITENKTLCIKNIICSRKVRIFFHPQPRALIAMLHDARVRVPLRVLRRPWQFSGRGWRVRAGLPGARGVGGGGV